MLAHIMGVPVEETLLSLGPIGAAGLGGVFLYARARIARARRRRVSE